MGGGRGESYEIPQLCDFKIGVLRKKVTPSDPGHPRTPGHGPRGWRGSGRGEGRGSSERHLAVAVACQIIHCEVLDRGGAIGAC